jgi:phosphoribosylformylglycinamidine (FGAM) synthase-like enzyme
MTQTHRQTYVFTASLQINDRKQSSRGQAIRRSPPELVDEHGISAHEYGLILGILGREPTFTELGVFSAMWSEHCGYKNSKPLLRTLPTEGAMGAAGAGRERGCDRRG